jgi:hypothetical protein
MSENMPGQRENPSSREKFNEVLCGFLTTGWLGGDETDILERLEPGRRSGDGGVEGLRRAVVGRWTPDGEVGATTELGLDRAMAVLGRGRVVLPTWETSAGGVVAETGDGGRLNGDLGGCLVLWANMAYGLIPNDGDGGNCPTGTVGGLGNSRDAGRDPRSEARLKSGLIRTRIPVSSRQYESD